MAKIQPLADRVLVRPVAAETTTKAGIIIPDNAKEKPLRGDQVLYGKYAGTELELDGEKYLIMRQSDVLAQII